MCTNFVFCTKVCLPMLSENNNFTEADKLTGKLNNHRSDCDLIFGKILADQLIIAPTGYIQTCFLQQYSTVQSVCKEKNVYEISRLPNFHSPCRTLPGYSLMWHQQKQWRSQMRW